MVTQYINWGYHTSGSDTNYDLDSIIQYDKDGNVTKNSSWKCSQTKNNPDIHLDGQFITVGLENQSTIGMVEIYLPGYADPKKQKDNVDKLIVAVSEDEWGNSFIQSEVIETNGQNVIRVFIKPIKTGQVQLHVIEEEVTEIVGIKIYTKA